MVQDSPPNHDAAFIERLLDVIENDIVPVTDAAVRDGNKLFGAAIIRKSDLSLIAAETNRELEWPLLHGEVSCLSPHRLIGTLRLEVEMSARCSEIQVAGSLINDPARPLPCEVQLHGQAHMPAAKIITLQEVELIAGRIQARPKGLLLHSHARAMFAVSICDHVVRIRQLLLPLQLRRYEDAFNIPHDLKILQEVFKCDHGDYARQNAFWTAYDICQLIEGLSHDESEHNKLRVTRLRDTYDGLSSTYQESKADNGVPLS